MSKSKLGLITGCGTLPLLIIDELNRNNREYYIISIEGNENDYIKPDITIGIGLIGKIISILSAQKINEIVFAGSIKRPSLSSIKLDFIGAKLLSIITKNKILGDDNILSTIIKFLNDFNFKVIAPNEIVPNILISKNIVTNLKPNDDDIKNIKFGKKILRTISDFDIGQSIIIENLRVLGIEAAEGTDELIKRCNILKKEDRSAILIKTKKTNQNDKIDLPTIGSNTIENAIKSGLKGIAIESDSTIIIDLKNIVKKANQYNLFIASI